MFLNSIRWRLQLWHGVILVAVLASFGVSTYYLERANLWRRVDFELQERVVTLARLVRAPFEMRWPDGFGFDRSSTNRIRSNGTNKSQIDDASESEQRTFQRGADLAFMTETNDFYFIVWLPDGRVQTKSENAPNDVPKPEPHQDRETYRVRVRGKAREISYFTPHGRFFVVGRLMDNELAELRKSLLKLATAGVAVLLLGLVGGGWLATRAIRPIENISATAVKIANGDLSQRIDAGDMDSELGRLAGVLNSTFARLEAAFLQQARFTSDAAHELRTPVTVLLTQTQAALKRERTAAELRETVTACHRAAQRMRRLIESLLELARFDAGQEVLRRMEYDLGQATKECADLVQPLADERHIQLRTVLPITNCRGDCERMKQVITNLLTNAIRHNKEHGTVCVELKNEGDDVLLMVADNGPGISVEHLPHIFERFYCADAARSSSEGQAGLGLAISKAIVEAHSGTITVESAPGEGAKFKVRVPRQG